MARITVEDCLREVNNRFALIHLAAKRVRQLRKGAEPSIVSKNKDVVIALREIAAGSVVKTERVETNDLLQESADTLSQELKKEVDASDQNEQEGEEAASEGQKL